MSTHGLTLRCRVWIIHCGLDEMIVRLTIVCYPGANYLAMVSICFAMLVICGENGKGNCVEILTVAKKIFLEWLRKFEVN